MRHFVPKAATVTALVLATMLQGWPLLVTSSCNMAGQQAVAASACCCCSDIVETCAPQYASCNPGKILTGILSTAPSARPNDETNTKNPFSHTSIAYSLIAVDRDSHSSAPSRLTTESIFLRTTSPPLFLLDNVFRI
jgi:hypothetical protein